MTMKHAPGRSPARGSAILVMLGGVVAYFPLCFMSLFSTHGQYALCGSLSHPELARVQPR